MHHVPWQGWQNAEIYHDFVTRHPIYRRLNERLVELAEVEAAHRILDLACGTGATTQAALPRLAPSAEIVGADASEPMVEVARARTLDPRARFVVAAASAVGEIEGAPFDRVLCNAAIWQFPSLEPVADALGSVTAAGAIFVFNVPAERVSDESAPIHPFQVALARAVEERTGRAFSRTPSGFDVPSIRNILERAGFSLETPERFVYRGRQRELVELMRIPAMTAPLAPGLPWPERLEIIDAAEQRVDLDDVVEVPWIYFRAIRS
ncbi:MAG: class I SAM-dependent DNA methyltransferase, partial [Thermoanaerobaculia bacterium]